MTATLTPFIMDARTNTPVPFTGVGAENALDAISAHAESFYGVTYLGRDTYGQSGFCPCESGHDGLPNSWIEYREPGSFFTSKQIRVQFCDAVSS